MSSQKIEQAILAEVSKRGPDKSTCPSEIARMLFPGDWRKQMPAVREAALHLQELGRVLITQKGAPVDVHQLKGPVRIKSR